MSYPVKDALSRLYPPIEPHKTGKLKASDLHDLHRFDPLNSRALLAATDKLAH